MGRVKRLILFMIDHFHKFLCKSTVPVFDLGNTEEKCINYMMKYIIFVPGSEL